MKKIKTKKGLISFVSDVDYQFIYSFKWYFSRGYLRNNKLGYLHKVIMQRMLDNDIPTGFEVDHINRNKLDNRRDNLRLATRAENKVNSSKRIGLSGYRGVRKQKGRTRWRADIQINGKKELIGAYATKEEAALAYNKKAKETWGEFAYLNSF